MSTGELHRQIRRVKSGLCCLILPRVGGLVALIVLLLLCVPRVVAESSSGYVGSSRCQECHASVVADWSGSPHSWAWRVPTAGNVLGDFEKKELISQGVATKFRKKGDRYYFECDALGGRKWLEVKGAIGLEPLQQYIFETEPGRYQSHDVVWDTEQKRWYHLYPDQKHVPGDGLHWSGPYKNWNTRCAVCHATNYRTKYDAKERSYSSTFSERGVGCEACHGPAQGHLTWAAAQKDAPKGSDQTKGFARNPRPTDAESEIQSCAPCHSRREPLSDASVPPGTPFFDRHRLELLREGLYHPDGQIEDEVYVYGSFLQSKMYAKGVRCGDCHQVHSTKVKVEGDALCTGCHNVAGNPKFPSLKKSEYSSASHHFHKPDSAGAQCANCHMTGKTYMGTDFRHDHSFRIPRPDLSVKIGVPNACTGCHTDKTDSWAAAQVKRWYPRGRWQEKHFGEVLAQARKGLDAKIIDQLVTLSLDQKYSPIVRATALTMLGRTRLNSELYARVSSLLNDPSPLVRAEAVFAQRFAHVPLRLERLIDRTRDASALVRLTSVSALLSVHPASLSESQKTDIARVTKEFQSSFLLRADYPESYLQLAGVAMVLRNLAAADAALAEATRLDPQLVIAWLTRARLQHGIGNTERAKGLIEEALVKNPAQEDLVRFLRNPG